MSTKRTQLEWIATLKDKMKGSLGKMQANIDKVKKVADGTERSVGKSYDKMQGKLAKFQAKNLSVFQGIQEVMPGAASAVSTLVNPYVAVGAAAAGAVAIMSSSVMKAKEFKTQFRELETLNLDKTNEQLDMLKNNVLASAFEAGKGTKQMTQAYYDIQSITGKYGNEIQTITERVSKFSTATQSDFNKQIESASTIIDVYGSKVSDLDSILASTAKTIQVGKVNFADFARVQVDYLGKAKAAGQNIDSANKLFAVFSKRTKSAEEAATLTKGALQDLTKKSTIKSLEKIGISLFDKKGGVKQISQVVQELDARLSKLRGNDQAISKIVNSFQGNEGLKALIAETATNGNELVRVFEQFDKTEFNIDKAFANAKKDVSVLSEMIGNKVNVLMIQLGERILPTVLKVLQKIDNKMPQITYHIDRWIIGFEKTASQIGSVVAVLEKAIKVYLKFNPLNTKSPGDLGNKAGSFLRNSFGGNKDNEQFLKDLGLYELPLDKITKFRLRTNATEAREKFNGNDDLAGNKAIVKLLEKAQIGSIKGGNKVLDFFNDRTRDLRIKELSKGIDSKPRPGNNKPIAPKLPKSITTNEVDQVLGTSNSRSSEIAGVVAGGKSVKNINVNINQLIGEVKNIIDQSSGIDVDQVMEIVERGLISAIRDVEVTLASDL